jgi:glycosyltransferase involved in cell wall biosynthesis
MITKELELNNDCSLKILYDPQIFIWQKFGGISRYFYELIKNLDVDITYRFPLYLSNNRYIKCGDISNHFHFFYNTEFKGKYRIMNQFNRIGFYRTVKKNFDILHPTYYDPYFLNYIKHKPFVLTVHDMIHEQYDMNDTATTRNKRLLCEKAIKIIAISENTKKDLINLFNIDAEKITVIYEGQSLCPPKTQSMNLPNYYILFTGQRDRYKNFNRFVTAFSILAQKYKDLQLICTGSPFTQKERILFNNLKISQSVQCFFVCDEQLAELYQKAQLFVFPSEYEGFGIPILEAFACGCPIVLSNTSCFPEIAGNAGVYFNPQEIDDMVFAIQKVLDSDNLRKTMIEKGTKKLTNYSWKKMGKEISTLYKSIV